MEIQTILTPAEIAVLPQRDLRGVTCVVFDVLRATSTIVTALANGARRIYPVLTVEEVFEWRGRLPGALLGGERGGKRIDGFDLGNSPREYTAATVAGRDIITTTTNGTGALRACADAGTVLAAAWLNLDATARWLLANHPVAERVLLVCAGTGERFALEDGLAAGALAARLNARTECAWDDATAAMLALHEQHAADALAVMRASDNGRRLLEIGLDGDIEWCARDSVLDTVAVLRGEAVENASAGGVV